MKRLLFTVLCGLMCQLSWAQFTISGTITDANNNEPLIGATVTILGTTKGDVSNTEGKYSVTLPEKGTYTLIYSFIGYEIVRKEFEVTANITANVEMTERAFTLDGLNIYGKRLYPVTKTTIEKEDLAKVNLGQDLPILLNFTPSIVTTSDAGAGVGYTGFRIRGSDPQRINVTINGIPLNDSESHGVFWVNMPDFASSVENIAIQRGVGTSTNGAVAFGATVNLTTQQPSDEAFAMYNGSAGSFNTFKNNVQFGSGLINDKFKVTGRLSKITTDGFIDKASVDLKSFYLSGEYRTKAGTFTANVFSGKEITFQAWNGVPQEELDKGNRTFNELAGYDNEIDNYQQDHYQLLYNKKINKNWKVNGAFHYTKGRGYFEQYKDDESFSDYGLTDPQLQDALGNPITETDVIVRRWLDNDFYGFVASANYIDDKWDIIVGGGWNKYEGGHFGEVIWAEYTPQNGIRNRYYDNDATKSDYNLYAKATYQFFDSFYGFLDLQVRGIQYDFIGNFIQNNTTTVQLPQTADFTFFNPKVGFKYYKDQHEFYVSYAIGNKEPNRDDFVDNSQFSRPEHETLRNLEVGYQGDFNAFTVGSNVYWMDYTDQLVLTGKINDVGEYTRTNVNESYRLGVELQAGWMISEKFTWQANATFSQNKIKQFSEFIDIYDANSFASLGQEEIVHKDVDIAFSPNFIGANQLTFIPTEGLELGLMTKFVGQQFLDNTGNDDRKLDAYTTTDFRISYNFKAKGFQNVGLSLLVNNVFDEEYESNGYTFGWLTDNAGVRDRATFNYYYPQAGTNFLVGLQIRI